MSNRREKKVKPTGIVTESDMLKRILLESRDLEEIKGNEIISKPLIVGKLEMEIEDAVKLMFKRNIKKLSVANKKNLVGSVTLTDLVRSEQIIRMLKKLPS
jgi:signal-transduction protein with cAMP-binding, CBS, and nucleotidyltransferase domain